MSRPSRRVVLTGLAALALTATATVTPAHAAAPASPP